MLIDRTMRVLIVERRRTSARLIEDILRKLHFDNIEKATDATSAFAMLQEGGPALIIADLHLQPMSGLELLRMIRAKRGVDRYPCLITAETLTADEAKALKDAGVDGILIKPFTRRALEPKLTAAFERHVRSRRGQDVQITRKRSIALAGHSRYRRPR
jgi:DNA-binding response OmpR family regulator